MRVVLLRSVNCRMWVSLRVFGTESHYFCPFRYCLGLCLQKSTTNVVMLVLVWTSLWISFSSSHTHIGLPGLWGLTLIFRRASPSLLHESAPGGFLETRKEDDCLVGHSMSTSSQKLGRKLKSRVEERLHTFFDT